MYAYRIRITVPESHEISVRLPSDVPPGEAELIVLTEASATPGSTQRFKTWLDSWIRTLPAAVMLPQEETDSERNQG